MDLMQLRHQLQVILIENIKVKDVTVGASTESGIYGFTDAVDKMMKVIEEYASSKNKGEFYNRISELKENMISLILVMNELEEKTRAYDESTRIPKVDNQN